MKTIPEPVRRWYRRIGAKGGQAGKGTELRREIMRRNAHIRWNRAKAAQAFQEEELRKIFQPPVEIPIGFK